jgi:tetratricopeptide (TPR) repeat protein
VWLGTFYRTHARYAEAIQQYQDALKLTPDNARIYYVLGGLYGSIGRYDDAIEACRKSAALVPSVSAYMNWGATLANLRRFDDAVDKFNEARRVGPESYRLLETPRALFLNWRAKPRRCFILAPSSWCARCCQSTHAMSMPGEPAGYYAKRRSSAIEQLLMLPLTSTTRARPCLRRGHTDLAIVRQRSLHERAAAVSPPAGCTGIRLDVLRTNPRFAALTLTVSKGGACPSHLRLDRTFPGR